MGESTFVAWDGESGLVGDVRHFPILVMTLYGTLTEQLVDEYGKWVAQTIALGHERNSPFVVLVDAREAGRPPATVRKRFADMLDSFGDDGKLLLEAFVILESTLIRGALTAIQWVLRLDVAMTPVASMASALGRARVRLEQEQLDVPTTIGHDYVAPVSPPRTG